MDSVKCLEDCFEIFENSNHHNLKLYIRDDAQRLMTNDKSQPLASYMLQHANSESHLLIFYFLF